MKSNTLGVQILVMAHVIGHAAFFTMNKYFAKTNKDIIQIMDIATKRFNDYEKSYGLDEVERIVDAAHSLQFHSSPFENDSEQKRKERVFEMRKKQAHKVSKAEFNDINNPVDLNKKVKGDIQRFNQKLWRSILRKTPIEPSGDILRYIIDYSTILEDWQKDICEILRKEGQYFWPQMKTKYMNEGFAAYWHEKMINRLYREGHINDTEHAEFNYSNALVLAKNPTSMNPYLVGYKIWADIVERWDKGQHGDEYDRIKSIKEKENWDTKEMLGLSKMLDVVRTYQDWFFVMDFLTTQLVEDLNLYIYVLQETPDAHQIVRTKHTAGQVKELIIKSFAHSHIPKVEIVNTNYGDSGKLYLEHRHVGSDLLMEYAKKTMEHIRTLWGRDCILKTKIDKEDHTITATKTEIKIKKIEKPEVNPDEIPI
jgi:stage V sporulation protein R